jgi:hypothetical protein
MSLAVDIKFVHLVAGRLEKFKQKNSMVWSFRCPLCGDSQRNKNKTRGHIYQRNNKLYYRCFNCEAGSLFGNFLKQIDPSLYRDYHFEKFRNPTPTTPSLPKEKPTPIGGKDAKIGLPSCASIPFSHPAKQFLISRKIPPKWYDRLYYAYDFKGFCNELVPDFFKREHRQMPSNDRRIVIPWYDRDGVLRGFQGRALDPTSEIRYITVKLHEDNIKCYGLDTVDFSKRIFVTEGPFDSLFLDNALAAMDSALWSVTQHSLDSEYTLIFDNEPRNPQIVRNISRAIELGHDVVVWTKSIEQKDINDMVLAGIDVRDWISKRTYNGVRAKLELQNWKKI